MADSVTLTCDPEIGLGSSFCSVYNQDLSTHLFSSRLDEQMWIDSHMDRQKLGFWTDFGRNDNLKKLRRNELLAKVPAESDKVCTSQANCYTCSEVPGSQSETIVACV